MRLTHVLLFLAACLSTTSCRTRECKSGTLLLTLDYGTLPDDLDVALSLAYPGEAPTTSSLTRTGKKTTGSVEIEFARGYHAGQLLDIAVVATSGGMVVGQAMTSFALTPSCSTLTLDVASGEGLDAGAGSGDGGPTDLRHGPEDLAGLVFPTNVSSAFLDASQADWTITAATTIDTSQTDVADAISPVPPPGVLFTIEGTVAVLAVHDLSIAGSTALTIKGTRPLVIVAGGSIMVNGMVDASAHGTSPGPGGAASGAGLGAGGIGTIVESPDVLISGGAGGTFGTSGGVGGSISTYMGGATKAVYGTDELTPPMAGSGGGSGGSFSCTPTNAPGGAGGGFLQMSARTSIVVATLSSVGTIPSGVIAVGGGGGGSCTSGVGAGGGGGSGGGLLIESPVVNVMGLIDAAGGGGGSQSTSGDDGIYPALLTAGSLGGTATPGTTNAGGAGSNQVTAAPAAQAGGMGVAGTSSSSPTGAGGGGGGAGRLRVRSSGAATIASTTTTPTLDPTLPDMIP